MSSNNIKNILGLDYGERRIGVSVSVMDGKMAVPHSIISYKKTEDALSQIKRIILEYNTKMIVLGLPITMKNKEGFKAEEVLKFKEVLEKSTSLEVILEDERLSTSQAKKSINPNSKNKRVDDSAATIILNSFLEKRSEQA
ncbi:MAG: Holliday junction resolvase RuvX [Chloroflexota bacterium]|nr:Holliday junction resolvase RuvX [Chloroflexota bacterium]